MTLPVSHMCSSPNSLGRVQLTTFSLTDVLVEDDVFLELFDGANAVGASDAVVGAAVDAVVGAAVLVARVDAVVVHELGRVLHLFGHFSLITTSKWQKRSDSAVHQCMSVHRTSLFLSVTMVLVVVAVDVVTVVVVVETPKSGFQKSEESKASGEHMQLMVCVSGLAFLSV